MLVGDGWAFIHIPKCGGTTIRAHLKGREVSQVLPMQGYNTVDHTFHWVAANRPEGRIFTVTRSPVSWLRSYWGHRMRHGWRDEMELDKHRTNSLDEFMLRVAQHDPGYVSLLLDTYVNFYVGNVEVFDISQMQKALKYATGRTVSLRHSNRGRSMPVPRLATLEAVEDKL